MNWRQKKRFAIWERDRGICRLCGERVAFDVSTIDHITPRFFDGGHTAENLQIAHRLCNSKKGCVDRRHLKPAFKLTMFPDPPTVAVMDLLQDHFNLDKPGVIRLALKRLAEAEGLVPRTQPLTTPLDEEESPDAD